VRDAIACTFLLVYIILVIYGVFFAHPGPGVAVAPYPEATALINSFTTVASVVIGFYFAAGTADKFVRSRRRSEKSESEPGSVNPSNTGKGENE
jgi:hypothetical protein